MTTPRGIALITGASSGIGRSLARQFVDHSYDVVIAAEDAGIREAAADLKSSGRQVVPVQTDLTTSNGVEELWRTVADLERPLDAAVLNAGVGVGGTVADTPLESHLEVVDLNVRSTVHLAKRVIDQMVAQGHGRILVTASIAGTAPGPYHATYAASKAFGHSFAEGIRHELADRGVTVTSLMPGPTDTEFFSRAGMENTELAQGHLDDPDRVAKEGFEALMGGKPHVVAGAFRNRVISEVATHLPDRVSTRAMAAQAKPKS